MNIKPKQPKTVGQALRLGVVRALSLFLPGAAIFAVAAMQPIPMDFVSPEGHESAVVRTQEQRQAEKAQAKCEALPANTLPGAAVIDWADERGIVYTTKPADVDRVFSIAVGETQQDSAIEAFDLCR
jgi:hypothetical protein